VIIACAEEVRVRIACVLYWSCVGARACVRVAKFDRQPVPCGVATAFVSKALHPDPSRRIMQIVCVIKKRKDRGQLIVSVTAVQSVRVWRCSSCKLGTKSHAAARRKSNARINFLLPRIVVGAHDMGARASGLGPLLFQTSLIVALPSGTSRTFKRG
jgi:hypothetical protein